MVKSELFTLLNPISYIYSSHKNKVESEVGAYDIHVKFSNYLQRKKGEKYISFLAFQMNYCTVSKQTSLLIHLGRFMVLFYNIFGILTALLFDTAAENHNIFCLYFKQPKCLRFFKSWLNNMVVNFHQSAATSEIYFLGRHFMARFILFLSISKQRALRID